MMAKIDFVKMVASGNDFIVTEARSQKLEAGNFPGLAKKICDRKYGIGADGLLLVGKSRTADFKMRVFNPDGSEAEMCGNGLRCVALYRNQKPAARGEPRLPRFAGEAGQRREYRNQKKMKIETKAGILEAFVNKDLVKVKMTEPGDIKMDIPLNINGEKYSVNFINTGVPHAILFVNHLGNTNVKGLGKIIRFHPRFLPQGTNVDFVETKNKGNILLRTYERGVEDETLACGTGTVASAIISGLRLKVKGAKCKINVKTQGGEILQVYFDNFKNRISNVYLEGKAEIVFIGKMNI